MSAPGTRVALLAHWYHNKIVSHYTDQDTLRQDTWEGLMNAGQTALLPQLPLLVQAAQQLSAWHATLQCRLRQAAAELRRLAELNAAFSRELVGQPGCGPLVQFLDALFLAFFRGYDWGLGFGLAALQCRLDS